MQMNTSGLAAGRLGISILSSDGKSSALHGRTIDLRSIVFNEDIQCEIYRWELGLQYVHIQPFVPIV